MDKQRRSPILHARHLIIAVCPYLISFWIVDYYIRGSISRKRTYCTDAIRIIERSPLALPSVTVTKSAFEVSTPQLHHHNSCNFTQKIWSYQPWNHLFTLQTLFALAQPKLASPCRSKYCRGMSVLHINISSNRHCTTLQSKWYQAETRRLLRSWLGDLLWASASHLPSKVCQEVEYFPKYNAIESFDADSSHATCSCLVQDGSLSGIKRRSSLLYVTFKRISPSQKTTVDFDGISLICLWFQFVERSMVACDSSFFLKQYYSAIENSEVFDAITWQLGNVIKLIVWRPAKSSSLARMVICYWFQLCFGAAAALR